MIGKIKSIKNENIDIEFLKKIQISGGLLFKESYIRKGNGYETCIHLINSEYPKEVGVFWMHELSNIDNVIVTIDVGNTVKKEVVKGIKKSLEEQLNRIYYDKDNTEKILAKEKYSELERIFKDISSGGEIIKKLTVRIYVSDRTINGLEDKVKTILDKLESKRFKGSVMLNEQKEEMLSLFKSSDEMEILQKRKGKEMGAKTIAAGLPFHFTKLDDPNGTYLGNTFTGGNVLFDLFHRDNQRTSYSASMVGALGAGKSTLLKKLAMDNAVRGNFLRIIDITGEYKELVEELGGVNIAMDGSDGMVNPLQILKVDDKEDDEDSFTQHISKFSNFFRLVSPGYEENIYKDLEILLREFYIFKGIYKEEIKNKNLTGKKPKEYPILKDFLKFIQGMLYESIIKNEKGYLEKKMNPNLPETAKLRLESIEITLKNLIENYGSLFNGYSSISSIEDSQVVSFSIRSLSGLSESIFTAQIFNILNLIWDNMLKVGSKYKDLYDNKKIDWEDVRRYLVVIDEAHKIINSKNDHAVRYIVAFVREARKYFGGIVAVSQSIRDFVPDGNESGLSQIKIFFELNQYKFIMKQDENTIDTITNIFGNQITSSELQRVPKFSKGEVILSISGVRNIPFKVDVSQEELDLFKGGA